MELDQLLFKGLYRFYKKLTVTLDPEAEARRVSLELLKPRLTLLARALTGAAIDVVTAEREGGWSGDVFYLPANSSFCRRQEDNLNYYCFRVLYLSVQRELLLNWKLDGTYSEAESKKAAEQNSDQVLDSLFQQYAGVKPLFDLLKDELEQHYKRKEIPCDYSWLFGKWMKIGKTGLHAVTNNPEDRKIEKAAEITTELEANPSDEVETIAINQKQVEDNVVQNQFEKVDTASEFNGTFREMDGDDTLNDDEAAIRELNLRYTVRSDDPAHSVYKAELVQGTAAIHVDEGQASGFYLNYPEWDYKQKRYKQNFCKVYPSERKRAVTGFSAETNRKHKKTRNELIRLFSKLHHEYEQINRVNAGEEIDLDAAIESVVAMKGGHTPSENIYSSKRKRNKDLSVLLLLDTSLSADSYTDNIRVLDVEKSAAFLFGEVLNEFGVSFQIDTFSSRTRNNCRYQHVKQFGENWLHTRDRLGAIEAEAYTRIGTALRHAGTQVKKQANREKWIVLFSDGKPNDYDTYEGRYGIEDVKKALQELQNEHIRVFSLAIEKQAKYYLPQMFGHASYSILPHPTALPVAFGKFFKQLLISQP